MAMHVITMGYSQTSTAESDAYGSYGQPSIAQTAILKNLGPNAVAIANRTFPVDTSFEPYRREAFRHKSLPAQRQSINMTNIVGEGTVNTDGLWRREQNDWSAGVGQKYLDCKDSNMPHRLYKSKGVDVFSVELQATLLNDTKRFRQSTNTNLQIVRCGTYLFLIDGTNVFYYPVTGTGAYSSPTQMGTPTGVTAYYSICANDSRVFVATNNGIYYITLTAGSPTTTWSQWCGNDSNTGFTGYNLVRYCNERVIAASGNYLYCFATNHTIPSGSAPGSTSDLLMIHPNSGWVWSDATGGPSQIYFGGYVKQGSSVGYSAVFRSGLNTSGATASSPWTANYPVQALPMPMGEAVYSLETYLNYVFIGTNKGIRMAQTLSQYDPNATQAGDLKAGSYVPNLTQPVTAPVRAITGDGRFVYFGWSNYDSTSSGLGKLDLSTFIAGDPLSPVYASDLMASSTGEVLSMDWDTYNEIPVFAVSGAGFYQKDTAHLVPSGYIQSGGFTYGIPDNKIPVYFDYGVDFPSSPGAQVSATLTTAPFDGANAHNISISPATSDIFSEVYIDSGLSYPAETFLVTVTMTPSTDLMSSPILHRWTLKAWPTAVSETSIMVPIQLFSVNVIDGMEVFSDPYDSFMFLENLRRTQQIVTYQEGSLTADVIIETLDFLPHKRRGGYENGFEGDCVVTLKTIGGYNSYTGIPTI